MSKVRFVDSSIRVNSGGGTGGGDSSISASYALSASFAQTASYLLGSVTSASYAVTSSYAEYAVSASHEITKEVSSSYADTASLALSGNGPFTGSFTGSFIGNGTGLFSGSFSGSIPDAYQIISGSVSASISPNNGLKVNSGVEISLESGSAFSVIEEDAEAAYKNRLDFAYDQQDPTLTITARSATSLLHLKTGGASTGTTYNSQGQIIRNSAGVNYGITIGTGFNPSLGNQMTLGFYNRRWKNLYINTGDKISFGVNDSLNVDLVSLRHTVGTNELVISGSSDVTLDVKGNIISTGSLQVSGSVDIAIPSGSAFTITETDKDQTGRLDFTFDDGDPTLEIEGRSAVAKIVLSTNDGETNNLKIQSDGQVYASSAGPYTGSIKFLPNGIEAISVGTSDSPFIGSQTRPFYKYYMAQVGGQFISLGTYSKQQLFLNSSATGTQRSDGLYNQTSGIRFVVSGSEISGADGYLRNPNNQYFQIQDNSTGTGNNASIPFRVGKSGSLAINLNQSKGFGFAQYYTASAMVHVEAEPNYDLNLFQGNDVLGNNVFEVDRDGNLTVDAEISASGDLYARDGRFSRDGGAAEIEILASEIAGGIVGTQTSDHLHLRRFNINKFSLTDVKNISHQRLEVTGSVSASAYLGDGSQLTGIETDPFPYTGDAVITGSLTVGDNSSNDFDFIVDGGSIEIKRQNKNILRDYTSPGFSSGGAVIFGYRAMDSSAGQNQTVAIGRDAGYRQINSDYSVFLGYAAGGSSGNGNSDQSTIIGAEAGYNTKTSGNTFLGYRAGYDIANGTNNIIIGHYAASGSGDLSSQLRIGSGSLTVISASLETGEILLNTTTISGSLLNTGTVSIDNTDSPYTITGTQQFVLIDPSGGDVTINMPDAATYPGREIRFKLTQAAGANTVTLQRQGADTIDGATTYTDLDIQYESISTVSDGSTGWFIF